MRKILNPAGIARPASAYHHAVVIERSARELHMSGQLGERTDGSISTDFTEQAQQIWINIKAILAEGGMSVADIVKVTSYIVGREHVPAYVSVHRDAVGEHLPPWTLVLVAGLGRPAYLVEVEAVAVQWRAAGPAEREKARMALCRYRAIRASRAKGGPYSRVLELKRPPPLSDARPPRIPGRSGRRHRWPTAAARSVWSLGGKTPRAALPTRLLDDVSHHSLTSPCLTCRRRAVGLGAPGPPSVRRGLVIAH